MIPLLVLAGSLVVNYIQHRRGKPTICSTSRRHLPAILFVAGWSVFNAWFVRHWLKPRLARHGWF
jgi:hypothetical protein